MKYYTAILTTVKVVEYVSLSDENFVIYSILRLPCQIAIIDAVSSFVLIDVCPCSQA